MTKFKEVVDWVVRGVLNDFVSSNVIWYRSTQDVVVKKYKTTTKIYKYKNSARKH